MMILLLRKRLPSSFLCSISHRNGFIFSNLSSAIETLPPRSNFMAEYLISSCGFSPEKATRASRRISNITSPSKPDSVRHFLKHHGFTDPEIRTLISGYPPILRGDVDRDMEPNLRALREYSLGYPEHELRKFITRNPRALQLSSAIPRLEFWLTFLNGNKKRLFLAFTRTPGLIAHSIDKGASPRIALLKEYDLSRTGIGTLLVNGNNFMRMSTAKMELSLKKVQELGFVRGSSMFVVALAALSMVSSGKLRAKIELYRSFGWSEEDLISALQKFPICVRLSDENIRAKMAFLMEKAECTPKYIALHPVNLGYSLEKRLIPRHHVMKILRFNGLVGGKWSVSTVMVLTDKSFKEKLILPYEDKLPRLLETYIAACAGKIPLLICNP